MWKIFHIILSIPQNIVMDLNNVMSQTYSLEFVEEGVVYYYSTTIFVFYLTPIFDSIEFCSRAPHHHPAHKPMPPSAPELYMQRETPAGPTMWKPLRGPSSSGEKIAGAPKKIKINAFLLMARPQGHLHQ